ncbi:MAG: hypothetical protein ACFB9N_17900 [Geitlerinemataceae cyanobacterium]
MNDEMIWLGRDLGPRFKHHFLAYGRVLFGLYHSIVYDFVEYSVRKIQFVRLINFVGVSGLAVLLLWHLRKMLAHKILAVFAVLFFFAQPIFQGILAYSLQIISNFQPAAWLSLLAFWIHFFSPISQAQSKTASITKVLLVAFVLILSLQSTQTYSFVFAIPLSIGALCKPEKFSFKSSSIFLGTAFSCLLFSTALYKVSTSMTDLGYSKGRQLMSLSEKPVDAILNFFNPVTYSSAFRVWNYPVLFNNLESVPKTGKSIVAVLVLLVFVATIAIGIRTHLQRVNRNGGDALKEVVLPWILAAACLSFGALFIFAESPFKPTDVRPHMTITFVGVCLMMFVFSLDILLQHWSTKFERERNRSVAIVAGFLCVSFVLLGAQSNALRNLVEVHADALDFVRLELLSKRPQDYQVVQVVQAKSMCVSEPCEPWMGQQINAKWNKKAYKTEAGYRYAMASLRIKPNGKRIEYLDERPAEIASDAVVIDWQRYLETKKRYKQYLRKSWRR